MKYVIWSVILGVLLQLPAFAQAADIRCASTAKSKVRNQAVVLMDKHLKNCAAANDPNPMCVTYSLEANNVEVLEMAGDLVGLRGECRSRLDETRGVVFSFAIDPATNLVSVSYRGENSDEWKVLNTGMACIRP